MSFTIVHSSPGSLLWEAANEGNLELLKRELAKPGVDIEVCDAMKRTPLVEAAKYDHPECVKELLLAGANPDHAAFLGRAIDYASNPVIKQMLMEASAAKLGTSNVGLHDEGSSMQKKPKKIKKSKKKSKNANKGKMPSESSSMQDLPSIADLNDVPPKLAMPCRYFAQGICRYGDKCRYEHRSSTTGGVGPQREVTHYCDDEILLFPRGTYDAINEALFSDDDSDEEEERMMNCGFTNSEMEDLLCHGVKPYDAINEALFSDDDSDEEEERMMNCGFTNSEMEDLLCQGVKPWDDDAWDVLAALRYY